MAQKQFTTYQADILSFELREALLGVVKPGRYSGFDQISADGTPDGTIYLILSHSSDAVQKLAKGGSSLGNPIGVAVTTQGTLIHEDDDTIDIDIPDNSAGGDYRWYVIYMEHDYVEVQGANNATYGYIAGTAGGGIPSLTEPYHRIILGYIRADANGTSISDLTFFPAATTPKVGDDRLSELLWGSGDGASLFLNTRNESGAEVGYVQSDGIIGKRTYTSQNYITNWDSITDSLNDLDLALYTEEISREAVGNRPIDAPIWGALTDTTDQNVNTSRHGLCPKLSGETDEYLRGDGSWEVPFAGFVFRNVTSNGFDEQSSARGGNITMGSVYEWDVSGIIPDGYDQALLVISLESLWGAANPNGRYGGVVISQGGSNNNGFVIHGPMPFEEGSIYSSVTYLRNTQVGLVKLSATKTIRFSWINFSGSITDWLYDIKVRLIAYR